MSKRRDRHARGLRGPLATYNPVTGSTIGLHRRERPVDYFISTVSDSVARIARSCPGAIQGVSVGVEEVPGVLGYDGRIPLAAARDRTPTTPAQVVLYRRPLEFRANSRADLADLVHRAIAEQLVILTGYPLDEIDPESRED